MPTSMEPPVPSPPAARRRGQIRRRFDRPGDPQGPLSRTGSRPGMVPTLLAAPSSAAAGSAATSTATTKMAPSPARCRRRPRDLFERVFGTVADRGANPMPRGSSGSSAACWTRSSTSTSFTPAHNSPLGSASKARVADHLDRIREFEQRAYGLKQKVADAPAASTAFRDRPRRPGRSRRPGDRHDARRTHHRVAADGGPLRAGDPDGPRPFRLDSPSSPPANGSGSPANITTTAEESVRVQRPASSSTLPATRAAATNGGTSSTRRKRTSSSGPRAHEDARGRLLPQPARRRRSREANGKTILDNSLITISTESGDGRHNDVKRELSGVFHAITGANGRFKTGQIMDVGAEGIDVYNTMLDAMGARKGLGPKDRERRPIDQIRA